VGVVFNSTGMIIDIMKPTVFRIIHKSGKDFILEKGKNLE